MDQEAVLVIGYRLLANVLTTACHAASARREEILTVEQLERIPCVTNSRGGEERKRRDYVTFVEDRSHDCLDVPCSPSQLGSFSGEGDPRPSNESEAKVEHFQIYCLDVTH